MQGELNYGTIKMEGLSALDIEHNISKNTTSLVEWKNSARAFEILAYTDAWKIEPVKTGLMKE